MPYILYTFPAFAPNLQVRGYNLQFLNKELRLKSLKTCPTLHREESQAAGTQTQP